MHKNWYFVRHGQTDFNKKHIVQGSGVDSSLNEEGQGQAKSFYDKYKTVPFDKVITSTLKRTHETMAKFIDAGIPWEQTADINEINWGIHEGKESAPWMVKAYKEMIGEWGAGNLDARLEDGESAGELIKRTTTFIEHLKTRSEDNLLICTHGRTLRCLMMVLKGQPVAEMENYRHSNTGLFKVRFENNIIKVEIENDVSHLD